MESDTDSDEYTTFIRVQYRGRVSDKFIKALQQSVPSGRKVRFVRFTHKLKSFLPSLKPRLANSHVSSVIYKITCASCMDAYVGMTFRHVLTRFYEHARDGAPVARHFASCGATMDPSTCLSLLCTDKRQRLPALEVLYIKLLSPQINIQLNVKSVHRLKVLTTVKPKICERLLFSR